MGELAKRQREKTQLNQFFNKNEMEIINKMKRAREREN